MALALVVCLAHVCNPVAGTVLARLEQIVEQIQMDMAWCVRNNERMRVRTATGDEAERVRALYEPLPPGYEFATVVRFDAMGECLCVTAPRLIPADTVH